MIERKPRQGMTLEEQQAILRERINRYGIRRLEKKGLTICEKARLIEAQDIKRRMERLLDRYKSGA